jgi:UDP-N-acetyl-D-mannosaminuronic acid dehydrogenase
MKKIFIIGGLGHIGLTFGAVLNQYYEVHLFDINKEAIDNFKSNNTALFYEFGLNDLLKNNKKMNLSLNIEDAKNCDYVIITIGTPIDEYLNPKLKDIFKLCNDLSKILTNQTIILRSTLYPGLTKKIEKVFKKTVNIAFCPERVAGGMMVKELQELPQIISANNLNALSKAKDLFIPLKIKIKELDNTTEAELAKLMTNTYRYIEFAVVNQFFMMAQENGCDFYKISEAMLYEYPRMKNFAKPGFTAGYCLRKDSLQLASWQNGATFSLGHDASLINESLPLWVFRRMRIKFEDISNKTIGLLGMAFKNDCDDIRDSLSYRMKHILENECKQVLCTDPFVQSSSFVDVNFLLEKSDIVILMTPHSSYKSLNIEKPIIDIWNFFNKGVGL